MTKITVLGADGFIGRHLVQALARQQDNSIIAFDRFTNMLKGAERPYSTLPNVTVLPGDFLNKQDITQAVDGSEYVFHLISTTTPATANNDPLVDLETNVRGTVELLTICVEKGVKKIIFPSSGGTIYGNVNSSSIDELTLPAPLSPYGIAKLSIEHYLRYFHNTSGLDYVIYRIANPYGPGQNIYGKQGVIPIFLHKFLTKEPLTIYGDGDMVRDYIYIDDLIEMMVGSYYKANKYAEYNLGSGDGKSVNDIVEAMQECTGYSVKRKHVSTPATFVKTSVLNTNRYIDEFGIVPHTKLADGIARTWEYVKNFK